MDYIIWLCEKFSLLYGFRFLFYSISSFHIIILSLLHNVHAFQRWWYLSTRYIWLARIRTKCFSLIYMILLLLQTTLTPPIDLEAYSRLFSIATAAACYFCLLLLFYFLFLLSFSTIFFSQDNFETFIDKKNTELNTD